MNKKVIKYCHNTLEKIINYHIDNNLIKVETLLDINIDLKKILTINTVNRYRIQKYDQINNEEFFNKLRDLLCEKYIQTEIVKQWLLLFTNNSKIDFQEILEAADHYNSNTLEVMVKIKNCIDLNEYRKKQIIDSVLIQAKKESQNENNYQLFIVYLEDKNEKEYSCVFTKEYIEELERNEISDSRISKDELLNTIFDYFIINKPKEKL